MDNIIERYAASFDDCSPIVYEGLTIKPFTVRQMRECYSACYCLSVDPTVFDDMSLLPLKRLDFIQTIVQRSEVGVPKKKGAIEQYAGVHNSFNLLLHYLFDGYYVLWGDVYNHQITKGLSLIRKEEYEAAQANAARDLSVIRLTPKAFEGLADLILYQNAIDVSYRQIPAAMRQELERHRMLLSSSKSTPPFDIEKAVDVAFLYLKDYELIMNLPVRKFMNLIYNISNRQDYQIYTNGNYTVKNLQNWMYGGYDRNPYSHVFEIYDQAKYDKYNV